jgi:hypothetical protein
MVVGSDARYLGKPTPKKPTTFGENANKEKISGRPE